MNWELDSLFLYFLSVHFSCRGILSASGVYRVDFTWYHFIFSSSLALGRDATRISMGFSPHQLPYCLWYFLHSYMESAISCMLSVWVWKHIYYLSSKQYVGEFCGPKSSGCKSPFLPDLSRIQWKPVYPHKEDFSVQAREFNSTTHYLLICVSFILQIILQDLWISNSVAYSLCCQQHSKV